MISPTSLFTPAEDAVSLHLLGLIDVVLGRRDVVHRVGLEPVHQPQVDQCHQPLLAQLGRVGVLVAHRQDAAAVPVLDRIEHHVGELLAVGVAEDGQLQHIRAGAARAATAPAAAHRACSARSTAPASPQAASWAPRSAPGAAPGSNPCPSTWWWPCGPTTPPVPRRCAGRRPGSAACGRAIRQPHLALQPRQRQHAVLTQRGGELLGRHTVDLVAAVGHEVEDEAHLAEFLGEGPHLLVGHAGGVPVERRGQVVGQHLVRVHRMDGLGELPGVGQVGGLGLHPQQVRERCCGKGFRDRVRDAAAHLVVALRGLGPARSPTVRRHRVLRAFALRGVQRGGLGELQPLGGLHRQGFALALLEPQHLGDGVAVGVQAGVVLPGVDELRLDLVEQRVQGLVAVRGPAGRRLVDQRGDTAGRPSQASAAAYSPSGSA